MPNLSEALTPELTGLPIFPPEKIKELLGVILSELDLLPLDDDERQAIWNRMEAFQNQWQIVFNRFGDQYRGELAYRDLIADFSQNIAPLVSKKLSKSESARQAIRSLLDCLDGSTPKPSVLQMVSRFRKTVKIEEKLPQTAGDPPCFSQPIFIVSAPRAGSTLLFETLRQFPELWTIKDESHEIIESIPQLHPENRNYRSNRLTAEDVTPAITQTLREGFTPYLQDRNGQKYIYLQEEQRPQKIRFLEKTPKNALRIPFLKAIFPDARFIYLYRDPEENISSLMEGWRSRKFIAYQPLPGWPYQQWCFLLVPGWESQKESSIAEIAAYQWLSANNYILEDLEQLPSQDWCFVSYQDLIQYPQETLTKIAQFAQLQWDTQVDTLVSNPLPLAPRTLTPPSPDKWRKHEREILPLLPSLEPFMSKINQINSLLEKKNNDDNKNL